MTEDKNIPLNAALAQWTEAWDKAWVKAKEKAEHVTRQKMSRTEGRAAWANVIISSKNQPPLTLNAAYHATWKAAWVAAIEAANIVLTERDNAEKKMDPAGSDITSRAAKGRAAGISVWEAAGNPTK